MTVRGDGDRYVMGSLAVDLLLAVEIGAVGWGGEGFAGL